MAKERNPCIFELMIGQIGALTFGQVCLRVGEVALCYLLSRTCLPPAAYRAVLIILHRLSDRQLSLALL